MPVVENFGTTSLNETGFSFILSGPGVSATLTYGGSAVTPGQFGSWTPWSTEQRTSTIDVVWKNTATNQYLVWTVDLSGNYLGQTAPMAATSYALQALETSFSHDLNADGTTGVKTGATIEAVGTYKLVEQADAYAIMPTASSTGVTLKHAGAVVTSGQFANWTPVSVAQTSQGFEVAWKNAVTGQFQVWETDSNGHYLWDELGPTSGAAAAFQVYETVFGQDLNGDGTIGVKTTAVESTGATTLAQVANTYFLYANGTTTGPQLMRGGAVTVNQYAGWTPIAAEKTTYGYEVAWKNTGTGQYIVWATDANGNYLSDDVAAVSGSSNAFKAVEASFGQDLNGDTLTASTLEIEAQGTTKLVQVLDQFFLNEAGGTPGPLLRFSGAAVTAGQFGAWTPIGAEKTASGYEVVWKNGTADQFVVWTTDNHGNWLSQGPAVSGSSNAIQSREATFGQNFNGDGTTGLVTAAVETQGGTDLTQVGEGYFLYDSGTSTGPQLKYAGAAYVSGQFGGWTPIGAEKTASGYQVAWKVSGADQYLMWTTDSNGNWLSQTAVMSGASNALRSFEPDFAQNLNGDGVTESAPSPIESQGNTSLVQFLDRFFLNPSSGSSWGPELSRGGMPVTAGQYGAWAPIGAEQTANGYQVAWKNTETGQYIVWSTDNAGNYLSDVTGAVAGSSTDLRALEPAFAQDLNLDTSTASVTSIESTGTARLVQVLDRYFLETSGGIWGPELRMGGTPVTAGQFAGWTPIQAEKNSAGYLVGWQNGSQFIFWTTDKAGNYQSDSGVLPTSSAALAPYEAIFNHDFDGANGVASAGSPLESAGATSLYGVGFNYFLKSTGDGGVVLKYGGSALAMNQFAGWAPVAVEQTSAGYEVAFKNAGNGQYVIWTTDSNANWTSQSSAMSGSSLAFQAREASFGQDINGDGRVGLPTGTIESAGAISLYGAGGGYFLGGATGPQLKYGGAAVTIGQFGDWTPVGVEQKGTGFEVAWKMAGADQYIVWLTDGSGNVQSMSNSWKAASYDLQVIETSFGQDLNSDGTVGAVSTQIETNGWSSLVKVANTYFVYETGSTNGPMLKFNGAAVTEGQFAGWTPVAVEKTATGYDVAWKATGDSYIVWATDNDGNYLSSLLPSANSNAMTSFEPTFHQDFGDPGSTVASVTTIESIGSASLLEINGKYFVGQSGGSMSTPLLHGSGFAQFIGWTPFAATATATGYQVAWQHADGVQKVVWNTDSAGHLLTSTASLFGSSSAFESYESAFQQDLNGDGFIGVPVSNFNIAVDYSGLEAAYRPYVDAAVARWQQIIVGDLPGVSTSSYGFIDDILIKVIDMAIDGNNGVLGQGGPDLIRSSTTNIPYHGQVTLDSFDLSRMAADGRMVYAIEHEIGHALGFNAQVWSLMGLLNGNGEFIGAHATYAYGMLLGIPTVSSVPISGGHLLESTFGKELMTSTMTTAGDPISIMTIAILEDMGYKVNYSAADPYRIQIGAGLQDSLAQGGTTQDALHNSDVVQDEVPDLHLASAQGDWLIR
jgi:hypothetical protein